MKGHLTEIRNKIFGLKELKHQVQQWKDSGERIVFTNGCFDLLHAGHVSYLAAAADLGTKLIIGLNSDSSLRGLKGPSRPLVAEDYRALLMASLGFVDGIVIFSEETPIKLIEMVLPDVLVKGGDYRIEDIVGAEAVVQNGGEVKTLPFVQGLSTSALISRIKGG